jgi:hypothetical protein
VTGACCTAADVVGVGVAHGVPADQWQCLGGSPWRREAFGAGSQGKGQRRRLGDDVAGRVCGARRARSGVAWHVWASRVLALAVHQRVDHRVWHAQEVKRSRGDKVWHAGMVQREREQVWVHAMPRHGMVWSNGDDGLLQTVSMAFGRVPGVQRSTNDDLGWMVEAKTHWFV